MKMKKKEEKKDVIEESNELQDFSIEIKKDITDIILDSPTIVKLGDTEYTTKNMRFYSVYRIAKLCMEMKEADALMVDDDNKIVTALCTDLDAMCEIMAIILCNHYFTPDGVQDDDEAKRRFANAYIALYQVIEQINRQFVIKDKDGRWRLGNINGIYATGMKNDLSCHNHRTYPSSQS